MADVYSVQDSSSSGARYQRVTCRQRASERTGMDYGRAVTAHHVFCAGRARHGASVSAFASRQASSSALRTGHILALGAAARQAEVADLRGV